MALSQGQRTQDLILPDGGPSAQEMNTIKGNFPCCGQSITFFDVDHNSFAKTPARCIKNVVTGESHNLSISFENL